MEVAGHAGVSKSAVSRVVSDCGGAVSPKTLDKVTTAIKELGYTRNTIAAGLRTQKTWIVLVQMKRCAWRTLSSPCCRVLRQLSIIGRDRLAGRGGIASPA